MGGYYARKENGLCPRCGKEVDDESYVLCSNCREMCRLWARENISILHAKNREKMKELYRERKNKGFCPRCGELRDENGYVMCKKCRAFNAEAQRKFRSKEAGKETKK